MSPDLPYPGLDGPDPEERGTHDGTSCPGGKEAHDAHLDVNGECPWCRHYCTEDDQ